MSPASSRPPRQAHSPRATSCRNRFLIRDRGSDFTASFCCRLPGHRHYHRAHRSAGAGWPSPGSWRVTAAWPARPCASTAAGTTPVTCTCSALAAPRKFLRKPEW